MAEQDPLIIDGRKIPVFPKPVGVLPGGSIEALLGNSSSKKDGHELLDIAQGNFERVGRNRYASKPNDQEPLTS